MYFDHNSDGGASREIDRRKAAVDTADTWAAERDQWMNAYYSLSAGRRVVSEYRCELCGR